MYLFLFIFFIFYIFINYFILLLFFLFIYLFIYFYFIYLFPIFLFNRLANLLATFMSISAWRELDYISLIVQWDVWIMASLNHQGKVKRSPGS